jgi:uncharacterized alpha-E superfamily protein
MSDSGLPDPLFVALQQQSPRSILLLTERLDRLTDVRRRMLATMDATEDVPHLKRAARRALDAMDVHLAALHQAMHAIQTNRWDPHLVTRLQDSWASLLESQQRLSQP